MKHLMTILAGVGLVLAAAGVARAALQVDIGRTSDPQLQTGWQEWNTESTSPQTASFSYADTTGGTLDARLAAASGVNARNYGISNITDPGNLTIPDVWTDQYFFNNNTGSSLTLTLDNLKAGTYDFTSYSYANSLAASSNDDGTVSVQVDTGSGFVDTGLDVTFVSGINGYTPVTAAKLDALATVSFQFTVANDDDQIGILYGPLSGGDTFGLNGFELDLAPPPPVPMAISQASAAPTDNVAIQQATSNGNAPWRFQQSAGADNNPRDAGQTFLVGPGGLVLDKITVRIDTLSSTGYDGDSFTLGLYEFTDASDVVPDPDKDSPIFTQTGLLPASLKSDFDGGADYLTIDLADQTLAAGQYGFLLMLDAPSGSTGDNMLVAIQTDEASYADGIAIRRRNRGTGSDAFSAQTFWTGSADNNLDMEFYLQAAPQAVIPEPSTFALAALGLIGLVGFARRRRRY